MKEDTNKLITPRDICRLAMLACLFAILLFNSGYERLPPHVNNGFGWDGKIYADNMINFEKNLAEKKLTQRFLPGMIMHYVVKMTGQSFTPDTVIKSHQYFNMVMIFIGVGFFFLISHHLKLTIPEEILGFSLIFFMYPVLKNSMYTACMMDYSAFGVALPILYFYLKDNKWLLALFILIGNSIYPTILLTGFVLLIFKKEPMVLKNTPGERKFINIAKIVAFIGFTIFLITNLTNVNKGTFNWASKYINFINEDTVMLSVPFLLAYVYFFYNRLINPNISLKAIPSYFSKVGIGITVVLFLITKLVLAPYFTPSLPALRLIQNVTMQGIVNPLTSLVSHVIYAGPVILLIAFFYKDFTKQVWKFGPGFFLFILGMSYFLIGSETRQFINVLPFLAIALLMGLRKYKINQVTAIGLAILGLVMSKFWYTINEPGIFTKVSIDIWLLFPQQKLGMSTGPWMSNSMYFVHVGIIALISAVLFFLVVKPLKENSITKQKVPLKRKQKATKKNRKK